MASFPRILNLRNWEAGSGSQGKQAVEVMKEVAPWLIVLFYQWCDPASSVTRHLKTRHWELCCLEWSQSVQIAPTKCHGVGQFKMLTQVHGSRRVGVCWGPTSSLHGKRDLIYESFFPPQHNHLPNTSLLIALFLWLVSLCVDLGIDTKLSDQRASAHSSFTCFPISSCWSL